MAANWQKILFSGSKIEAAQLSASNVPHIASADTSPSSSILTYDEDTGRINFISQSILQVPQGDTTFSISGSDLSGVNFDASASRLIITTDNPDYLAVSITSGSGGTTASFDPKDITIFGQVNPFITSSEQLDLISHSLADYNDQIITTLLNGGGIADNPLLYWYTNFYQKFIDVPASDFSINGNTNRIGSSDGGSTNSTIFGKVINDGPQTSSNFNLWIDPTSQIDPTTDAPIVANLDPNIPPFQPSISPVLPESTLFGRGNFAWLSASFLGGFTQGNVPSLSASFSTFTGSLFNNSSSIGDLQDSSSYITDTTSSMALVSYTGSFAKEFFPKKILSAFHGNAQIDQVTILDDSYSGTDFTIDPQGRKIQIGAAAPSESPLSGYEDARHLTIKGNFNANELALGKDGIVFEQMNVATVNGSITYGTSSLHTHEFIGNTFISGGGVDISGSVTIAANLPTENDNVAVDNPVQILVSKGNTLKFTTINDSNTVINDEIVSTATGVSQSFLDRISDIQDIIDLGPGQSDSIGLLQSGSDILTGSYSVGIFFATASRALDAVLDEDVSGSAESVLNVGASTSSFSSSISIGPNTDHTLFSDLLVPSHSHEGHVTTINYHFNTSSFISSTNIYTASQAIIDDVDGLNRYGKLTEGIITGSDPNDTSNVEYIANLADDLAGSPAGTHFLTGAAQPYGTVTNVPLLFNQYNNTSAGQGTINFSLNPDTNSPGGNYPAIFTGLATSDSPTFANLTVGTDSDPGTLNILGSLIQINKSQLNVGDQFILINSGALPNPDSQVANANDKDGGIIVGQGNESGSIFMYDSTHERWGFIGADGTNLQALDVESDDDTTLTPKLGVRAVAVETNLFGTDGTPKAISFFNYGNSTENTQLGIMAVNNIDPDNNHEGNEVFIYA